jgi:hypothetical protein
MAVLTMASSADVVPDMAWPLTILSVEAPMFTGFVGWVDPVKYTCWLPVTGGVQGFGAQARPTLLPARLIGDFRLVEPSFMVPERPPDL